MADKQLWANRECNKQVGNTSGFYALAFVYGIICGDKCFGKKAAIAIKDALSNHRSSVGEILSIYQLFEEWNLNFNEYIENYGYTASVVPINSAGDIYNLISKNSFIILPVISPESFLPHYEVLYGDAAFAHCWEPSFGTKYDFSIATEFLFNKKIPCFCNISNLKFKDEPLIYLKNHLRNFFLAHALIKFQKKAEEIRSEYSRMPVNLNGHCLLIRKTSQNRQAT